MIEVWISDGCILLREPEVGENKMSFSPMCFCPHIAFTAVSPHWEDQLIRSYVDPRLLSVCLSLLSISFSIDLLNFILYVLFF